MRRVAGQVGLARESAEGCLATEARIASLCGSIFGGDAMNDEAMILAFADEFFLVIFDEEKLLLQS